MAFTAKCLSHTIYAGLADLVDTNQQLTEEVRLVPTPGHSPCHVSVLIESKGERALITGDMTHHPVQWAEPQWGLDVDFDTVRAEKTRCEVIDEHLDSPTLIIGTHYPAPTAGRIVLVDGKVQFKT